MAVLSGMDSFRLESLPCYIFNVLTYSFHGPGFTKAPPYRLPDKWLPTAPITLPNGKVKSCGRDTQKGSSAEGLTATAVSVPPEGPHRQQEDMAGEHRHLRHYPASVGFLESSLPTMRLQNSAWKALSDTTVRWFPCLVAHINAGLMDTISFSYREQHQPPRNAHTINPTRCLFQNSSFLMQQSPVYPPPQTNKKKNHTNKNGAIYN